MPTDVPVIVIGIADGAGDRLADRLGRHPRLSRVPRSRLLSDLALSIERNQAALAVYGMPEQYWRKAMADFFDALQRAHVQRERKERWVTYIPSSSLGVEHLDRLYPTAQFVHVITRPRGGAGRVLSSNRRSGARLLPRRYLEVAEGDIVTDMEACADRVLHFLGEDGDRVIDIGVEVTVTEPEVVVDLADARLGEQR